MRGCALVSLLMAALTATAGDWGLCWIAHPAADDGRQLWFRRSFELQEPPIMARITIASSGLYSLFVNGYNVSTDVLVPEPTPADGGIAVMTFEVARFLRAGDNVVAVWYSPTQCNSKQLALSLYAIDGSDNACALRTDGTWLCREANACTTPDGNEIVDDNAYVADWNMPGASVMGWQHAEPQRMLPPSPLVIVPPVHMARRVASISRYTFLDDDGANVAYRFGHLFDGWVRVTLRGMHRGDTISVNGLTYICSGRTDEQACRQFTKSISSVAFISGPEGFSRENITNVEAIDIEEYLHRSWLY